MAGRTPREFSINIRKFADQAKGDMEEFATEFPQEVARQIVENTPVKTGNLRASWYAKWEGRTFSYINGTFYGPFVEFGTIFMAPRAFVRSVVDRAPQIAREVLARIRRG